MGAAPLDRTDPLPLWAQLEADLQRRIGAGEFGDGAFPTDLDLTSDYGVSRHTVREAIRHLNANGILRRERGRGTVINFAEFEQRLGTLYSLFRSVEATGAAQTSVVLELAIVTDATAAEHLELDASTPLLHLARLRCANDEPLAVDRAWLPAEGIEGLLDVDWGRTALYDELAAAGAPVPTEGVETLSPVVLDAADAELLGLPASSAAFHLERRGCLAGRPVEWRVTRIRGDRYRFVADWSAGGAAALAPRATAPG